ncbi:alpha/beta fold hydrolase [Sphingomicrobium sp. XHP0235]|uniref:alpha/beta fold hydrolase n=1 Tax=Sphingomicrobium aquimarinum TaxID=3133971 RepID=UPI0031FF3230
MLTRWIIGVAATLIAAVPAAAQDRSMELETTNGASKVEIWDASGDTPKGVILYGSGWGGSPSNYSTLLEGLSAAGYAVYAPVTLDSRQHADYSQENFSGMTGAQAIITDRMAATVALRDWFEAQMPEMPVVLSGHSFGSFVALTHAEGSWAFGPIPGPDIDAVLTYSSPGNVPMLVSDTSYTTIDLPLMMVTGTKDVGGQTFAQWEAHRLAFDRSVAGDKYLLVVEDGEHSLPRFLDESLTEPVLAASIAFLDAYVDKSAAALALLADGLEADRITIERR